MSALDLWLGYFQMALNPSDIVKTVFVTKNGTYAFRRMPFRLSGAAPNFQKAIDIILKPLIGNSGKTFFVRRILEIKLINSFPPKIIWRYGIYPKLFDKMSDIEFHEGMPFDVEDITNAFVIIDDLMNEVGDDKRTFKLVHERKPS
ncbi:uncharacterized protein TNCV_795841 [Trichonephila clavipes]|nr:uncharacterized protein TNCV_795841 [Trichonephila clavipes]